MTDTDVFGALWLVIILCLLGSIYIVLNMEVCMN